MNVLGRASQQSLRSLAQHPLRTRLSGTWVTALSGSALGSMAKTVHFQEVALEPGQRPTLPRSGHAAATLPAEHDAQVIVFGGYTETSDKSRAATNEAWVFSTATGSWKKVEYAKGDVPVGRIATQTVVMNQDLWLIGGWDPTAQGPDAFLNDVWKLDLQSYKWTRVEPQGEKLEGISRFQAVALPNSSKIPIHTHRSTEDVLTLDTASNPPTLAKVKVQGVAPTSRGLHSLTAVGSDGQLYLYGGAPQKGPMMDDVWQLDTTTMAWKQLQPQGTQPHERCSQAAAAVGRSVLYVGGAYYGAAGAGLEMLGDVHVLDVDEQQWIVPEVQGKVPCPRNASVMVPLPAKEDGSAQLLLYGGWAAFKESYNDTYLVTLS